MTEAYKSAYEVLEEMTTEGTADAKLAASYTPNNGIRVDIRITENDPEYAQYPDWLSFFFTDEQARTLGEALLRWAEDSRKGSEFIRRQALTNTNGDSDDR